MSIAAFAAEAAEEAPLALMIAALRCCTIEIKVSLSHGSSLIASVAGLMVRYSPHSNQPWMLAPPAGSQKHRKPEQNHRRHPHPVDSSSRNPSHPHTGDPCVALCAKEIHYRSVALLIIYM